jgi:hypothetical protein
VRSLQGWVNCVRHSISFVISLVDKAYPLNLERPALLVLTLTHSHLSTAETTLSLLHSVNGHKERSVLWSQALRYAFPSVVGVIWVEVLDVGHVSIANALGRFVEKGFI